MITKLSPAGHVNAKRKTLVKALFSLKKRGNLSEIRCEDYFGKKEYTINNISKMIGSKIAIANIKNDYPYGIKIIDNEWYLVNRAYDKISGGYMLSDESINKIVSIAIKLKGNRIETENTRTTGIWFYNDAFWKESEVYLKKYYESIKSVYKCLDEN